MQNTERKWYDHDKTCPGLKIDREQIPVKRRTRIKKKVVETKRVTEDEINIPKRIIEHEVKKRIQTSVQDRKQQRMELKEDRI